MYFRFASVPLFLEVGLDAVAQEDADVGLQAVAGFVDAGFLFEEILAGALGDDDDGMVALDDAAVQRGQKALGAVEVDGDFGNEHEIDLLRGHGGAGGDEAGVAPHELDQADAVGRASGFAVRAVEDGARRFDRGVVAERLADELDVVVDGLGHADDGDGQLAAGDFLRDGVGAPLGAVAADAEQDVDAALDEEIDHFADFLLSARGGKEGAAVAVDVVDQFRGQDERAAGPWRSGPGSRGGCRGLRGRHS